jgi:transposase-like protein
MPADFTRDPLPPHQITALSMLFMGATVAQVAEKMGVDRSTVHTWKNDWRFIQEYELRRKELLEATRQMGINAAQVAMSELVNLVQGKGSPLRDKRGNHLKDSSGKPRYESVPANVRLGAIQTILRINQIDKQISEVRLDVENPQVTAIANAIAALPVEDLTAMLGFGPKVIEAK